MYSRLASISRTQGIRKRVVALPQSVDTGEPSSHESTRCADPARSSAGAARRESVRARLAPLGQSLAAPRSGGHAGPAGGGAFYRVVGGASVHPFDHGRRLRRNARRQHRPARGVRPPRPLPGTGTRRGRRRPAAGRDRPGALPRSGGATRSKARRCRGATGRGEDVVGAVAGPGAPGDRGRPAGAGRREGRESPG